jgi:hypothetical protein
MNHCGEQCQYEQDIMDQQPGIEVARPLLAAKQRIPIPRRHSGADQRIANQMCGVFEFDLFHEFSVRRVLFEAVPVRSWQLSVLG